VVAVDWNDPDDLQGQAPDEAADSSPSTEEGPEGDAETREELEKANKQLRDELRGVRAGALVEQYQLLPSHAEALRQAPRDKQHELAVGFAAELSQYTEGVDPDLGPTRPRPAPTGAPSGGRVEGDQPSTSGPVQRTGGPQTDDEGETFADPETVEQIRAAKGWSDLDTALDAATRRQRDRDYPAVEMDLARIAEGVRDFNDYFSKLEDAKHAALQEARKKGAR
jgi:hypothetical protein